MHLVTLATAVVPLSYAALPGGFRRRAVRTRRYLRKSTPKVMVWAGAIPYSHMELLLERNPNLDPSEVLRARMTVIVAEVEDFHRSLVRYGCDNVVLIGVRIIHGAPSGSGARTATGGACFGNAEVNGLHHFF